MPRNLIVGTGHKFTKPQVNEAEIVVDERAAAQEAVRESDFDPFEVPYIPAATVTSNVILPTASNSSIEHAARKVRLLDLGNRHYIDPTEDHEIGNHGYSEKDRKRILRDAEMKLAGVREELRPLINRKGDYEMQIHDNWENDDEARLERLMLQSQTLRRLIRVMKVSDPDAGTD